MMYRLPALAGEWIDRSHALSFSFEGASYEGNSGDTISSALAAAGVLVMGRSFKYHRPRGILSFANHDVNALFQVGPLPNVRGDVVALRQGMEVYAVNTFGGLAADSARWMDKLSRFLPVGFYYKAFHSKRWFAQWERMIRNLSGLGRIPLDAQPQHTPKRYAFCDVLVLGGGVAGVSAALASARQGAHVLVIDENQRLDPASTESLKQQSGIEVLTGSYAAGCYADHWVAVIEPHRMTKVRARAVVHATGAIEQPLVFRNNDLPGVLLASAAQRLLRRHAVAVGHRVVVACITRTGYEAALDLLDGGVKVVAVLDLRTRFEDGDLAQALTEHGVEVLVGHSIVSGNAGFDGCLRSINVRSASSHSSRTIVCDALLMNGGWAAATQLLLQSGGSVGFDAGSQMHLPVSLPPGAFVAGRANGVFADSDARIDGERAGSEAAVHAGFAASSFSQHTAIQRVTHQAFTIEGNARGKDFIDFDEDLQVKDLQNAAQEGFDSIELLKRYSTVGMGPSQGKHSNVNAARVLAQVRQLPLSDVGLTTARPMYHPVALKHLAGRGFTPERVTPVAQRHRELNAVWMLAGNWRRPEYYARPNETREQCIAGEVAAVRGAVGLIDVGTLGKIEVHGPDAGTFLDRAYASRYSDLAVGMTRYGLLLDESGTIVDDGVVARLHTDCFYFTTTTGGSASMYRELLRLNAQWGLNCSLVNVTGHRGAFNLAGPRSRALLARLTSLDLSDAAFPYLGAREAQVAGVDVRLLRVGFVGELGYEIHVPFAAAPKVWDALWQAGADLNLRAFGVEAQRLLRLEKGHFIVGQDTDGLTNPFEAQAAWAVKLQKPFFIGQRSLRILQRRGPRQLLVGFEMPTPVPQLKECHLVIDRGDIGGRVTSVAYSQTLNKTIGLAMVKPTLASAGTTLTLRLSDGTLLKASVCPTPFYDRDNLRQKAVG